MSTLIFRRQCHASLSNSPPESSSDYLAQVAQVMASYADDPEAAQQALSELDTELLSEPTIEYYASNPYERGASPSDYEFIVSSFKRSNSPVIYLQWVLTANEAEPRPGPLDYVGLEWDTAYADHYLSSGDGNTCTVQGRSAGLVLCNVEDDALASGDYAYGTVEVEPIQTGWMEFGCKYVHTYTDNNLSGSAVCTIVPSASVDASGYSLGLTYTMSFTVKVNSVTNQWQIWTDNATNIYGT